MATLTHCYTAVWLKCTIQSVETMRDSSPKHLTMDSVLLKCHLTLFFRLDMVAELRTITDEVF
eukprot:4962636-Amphidinium_carterae.1